MRILVIGSGGREHALVWKIAQSPKADKIFCAPGNGGIREQAELVDIKADDVPALLKFAKENNIDLTVVGPELPLVKGIVNKFQESGLRIFGPDKELAMLEGSKIFAKEVMLEFGVPTADFKVFDDCDRSKEYLKQRTMPVVIKADGLCAGKGVVIANTIEEADEAVDSMLKKKVFGESCSKIIIEDCIEGEEVSILVLTDGKTILPLVSSHDHKRIFDRDKGPNTGGMGAYSPAPAVTGKIFNDIIDKVFLPVINGLRKKGRLYKGVLYGGLMMTKKGPMVLEFNVRFGDPETQAVIPRLKSDLVEVLAACTDGTLNRIKLEWDEQPSLCVVAASKGYPGVYEKHKEVRGLEDVNKGTGGNLVFHAGTVYENGKIWTSGGRVLAVSSSGKDIKSAKAKAYEAIEKIKFDGMYYRKDIGDKAIKK